MRVGSMPERTSLPHAISYMAAECAAASRRKCRRIQRWRSRRRGRDVLSVGATGARFPRPYRFLTGVSGPARTAPSCLSKHIITGHHIGRARQRGVKFCGWCENDHAQDSGIDGFRLEDHVMWLG